MHLLFFLPTRAVRNLQVRDTDSEAIAELGLDTFPSLVMLPADGSVVKYGGVPQAAHITHRIHQTCWAVLLRGLFASTVFDMPIFGMPADFDLEKHLSLYGAFQEADAQLLWMSVSICLSGTYSPLRAMQGSAVHPFVQAG